MGEGLGEVTDIPAIIAVTSSDIVELQTEFNISDAKLAAALGYPDQPEIVRRWKSGQKGGKPFVMVPSARAAFHYLRGLLRARAEGLTDGCYTTVFDTIPEGM